MLKNALNRLMEGETFSQQKAYQLMLNIAKETYSEAELAGFLIAYNMRSVTLEEMLGFRDAMLELAIDPQIDSDAIDLCGTGGDGKDTFNISTLSAFIVAGAGYKVAKHGNYGVSSICGSSNMLELLGYKFTTNPEQLNRQLNEFNLCFIHAPLFHPAMKKMAPVRKKLGVKTIFNLLGPLVNPSRPKNQLVGVFKYELLNLYQHVLEKSNTNYTIVHSIDGYDEVSLTSEYKLLTNRSNRLVAPSEFFSQVTAESIVGGKDLNSNKDIFLNILKGQGTKAQNDVVLANASLAIQTINPNVDRLAAIDQARISLESKSAYQTLIKILK